MKKFCMYLLTAILMTGLMSSDVFAANSGGTFKFCLPYGGQVFGLDPHKSTRTQDNIVELNIFRSLYQWDATTNKPVLALADKVVISGEDKVYTYSIKQNVKFHNGRNLTVDDIIWSYERIMSKELASPAAVDIRIIKGAKELEQGKVKTISGLKKIDAYTLEITLSNPVDPSYNLYKVSTAILPKEEVEKKGAAFTTNPVGCGPFMFEKWVKGSEVTLKKFPDYYEKGLPYLDKVVFKIMGEGAARDIAFKAKELDATIVGANQYLPYKKDPKISKNMIEVAEMYTRLMVFNLDDKNFADKRVRQAINYAINSKLIIEKYLKGKAFPTVSFLPTTSPAFDSTQKGYEYNLEKAKALMKEAGYEDGFSFEVLCTTSKSYGVGVIEAVIPFLKKINIEIKPQLVEGAVLAERARSGDFQALTWSLDSGPDPLDALSRFHMDNPRTSRNYPGYKNAEFSGLIDKAAKERDYAAKIELLKKADAMLKEDAPLWFFNYNKAIIAYHPWVHGIQSVAPEMMYQDLSKIWVDAK